MKLDDLRVQTLRECRHAGNLERAGRNHHLIGSDRLSINLEVEAPVFASVSISFRFGWLVAAVAMTMTLAMGLFGGMFPALRAVRLEVIAALREL